MKTDMIRNALKMAMPALALAWGLVALADAGTNELSLADNVSIHVASGETFTITNLTGYGWRLTKTGPGKLAIWAINNPNAKITLEEGTLEMANPVPDVLTDAFIHMDASASASLETVTLNGTNFVTRWNDVRGEGYPYATNIGMNAHLPFVNASYSFGNVVDFGGTYNSVKTDGYGAAMQWSRDLERPMDVFVVEQHNEDMRETILDAAAHGHTGVSYRDQAILGAVGATTAPYQTLVPGNPVSGHDSGGLVLSSAKAASSSGLACKFRVDGGAEIAGTSIANYFPGYDWHVYGFYPTQEQYLETEKAIINAFACERKKHLWRPANRGMHRIRHVADA